MRVSRADGSAPGVSETEIEERFATLSTALRDTIQQNPSSTIEPKRIHTDPNGIAALDVLAKLANAPAIGPNGAIRIEDTLGEGGMGIVHLGDQVALGRKVAVKSLRPEHQTRQATLKLLREAWVTGTLEHPNVVPVYSVALDDDGRPLIILKRIEGVHWGVVMHDERSVQKRFKARNALEWNLHVLMQVCNAVHFAHNRGIIHRDLKPENVMVGEFGEVYVLDWGIAVSTLDDGSGRLPLACDAHQMAGTPCYMAPEMLGGPKPRISERTDVYLLGAILFELLMGKPPHGGDNLMDIVRSIMVRKTAWPESVSSELARICDRAMDPDQDARFENVEQFRLAIEGFLQHRGSALLALEADAKLAELEHQLETATDETDARQMLYNLFGEARFGFQQALRQWRDNDPARDGLERAITMMVEYELSRAEPKPAALLMSELSAPPRELVERLRIAEQAQEAERQRGRDLDPLIGQRTRAFIGAILGLSWTIAPLGVEWVYGGDASFTHAQLAIVPAVCFVFIGGLGIWARESMSKTRLNRQVIFTLLFATATTAIFVVLAGVVGVSAQTANQLQIFLWFVYCGMMTLVMIPKLYPATLGYLVAFAITAFNPNWTMYCMAASNFTMFVTVVTIWRRTLFHRLRRRFQSSSSA